MPETNTSKAAPSDRTYATGKRKRAVARVWIFAGSGQLTINHRSVDVYFHRETSRMVLKQPLEMLEVADKYDVAATVAGGGLSAQAEAMRHGIARALALEDPERRRPLKRAGFLTRDAREKERKKYGRPGARKRFQFSKR
ncbi:30S ribosomal protein S9 [Myxococcota bacterium]